MDVEHSDSGDMNMDTSSQMEDTNHTEHKENGNLAYKSKDYRTAIAHYTLAIESARTLQLHEGDAGTLATYYNNRAAASTMILQYDEAVSDCDEAITLKPSFVKAYIRKAKAQVCLGALKEAMTTLHKAAIHDSNSSVIIQQKDEIDKLERRLQLAKDLLEKTNTKNQNDNHKQAYPPFSLPPFRDASQALKQLTVVIASCPAWRAILMYKIRALIAMDQVQEAYAATTTMVRSREYNYDQSSLMLYRAYALHHMGNLDDAMKHLKQILSLDPDNKSALAFRKILKVLGKKKEEGDGHYKTRDFEGAAQAYSEALDMTGCASLYRAKLFFNRACAHANLRKHAQVVADCDEAIKLDNEYVKAIMRRAASYIMLGEESHCLKAIQDYETVKDLAEKRGDTAQMKDLKKKMKEAQVALKRSKQKDFYKILNIPRDATEAEIKKSYKKSALKWHPDRHASSTDEEKNEAENKFRDINLAYEVLSDAQKKARYDSGVDVEDLDNPHAGQGHGGHGGHGGIDPNDLFRMFMHQQGGGGFPGGGGGGFHFG